MKFREYFSTIGCGTILGMTDYSKMDVEIYEGDRFTKSGRRKQGKTIHRKLYYNKKSDTYHIFYLGEKFKMI